MKITLPRKDRLYGNREYKIIDEQCFTNKYNFHLTYMCYWMKPDQTIYIKFLNHKPLDYMTGQEMEINMSNQYNHRLIKIENCYVIG